MAVLQDVHPCIVGCRVADISVTSRIAGCCKWQRVVHGPSCCSCPCLRQALPVVSVGADIHSSNERLGQAHGSFYYFEWCALCLKSTRRGRHNTAQHTWYSPTQSSCVTAGLIHLQSLKNAYHARHHAQHCLSKQGWRHIMCGYGQLTQSIR